MCGVYSLYGVYNMYGIFIMHKYTHIQICIYDIWYMWCGGRIYMCVVYMVWVCVICMLYVVCSHMMYMCEMFSRSG